MRGVSYLRGVISLNPEQELLGFLLLGAWAGYVAYRLEYRRAPLWVYGYLVVKVLAAWAFGWVYASYYGHGDTLRLYLTAERLWHYLVQEPGAGVALLFREFSQRFEEVGWAVYYRDVRLYDYDYDYFDPVNYRFARLVMPLYVAVGGGYYGMQGLMGLLSGLLWYGAYKRWREIVPLRGFGGVGFLLLPSVVFWGSGVLRDSLGLPLMLYVAGWLASASRRVSPGDAVGFLVAGIVLGLVRWEGLVLGVVAGIGYHFPWRRWWLWMVAGGVAWLILWVSAEKICAYQAYWLSPKERPELLEGAHVFRIDCRPGMVGAIWSWMQGVWYSLTGPYLWQVQKGVAFLSALETLAVWVMVGWFVWRRRKRLCWRPKAAFLMGVGLLVVGVVAMAMPFWGTVVRQRLYGWGFLWLSLMGLQECAEERAGSLR